MREVPTWFGLTKNWSSKTQSHMRGTLYTELGSTVFKSSTSETARTVCPIFTISFFFRYIGNYNIQRSLYFISWTFLFLLTTDPGTPGEPFSPPSPTVP